MDTKKSKTYEINDIISWSESQELNISPKYQRNPVWDDSAKSFLIDTIMRDFPMPPLFFRQIFDLNERKTIREVIDGQQRSRAIIEFYNNKFPILKKHNEIFGGKYFRDLDAEDQEQFLQYSIFVDTISEKDDSIIYDIFARLNSNAANVNKQEIRNAKFWGDFKTSVYAVSSKIRDFFLDFDVFNNKNLSRMKDMEFVSSLFILALEGCTNETATQIDKYYKEYDKSFDQSQDIEELIISTFGFIRKIFSNIDERRLIFRNLAYLYDLIGAVFVIRGVVNIDGYNINNPIESPTKIALNLQTLHYNIETVKSKKLSVEENVNIEIVDYEKNHRIHSTSKGIREQRIQFLLKNCFEKQNG